MPDLGKFTHLHVHSEYSTLDGANRIGALVKHVKSMGMGALALTDHGNLFGALQFQAACKKEDVKPIFGCELYYAPGGRRDRTSPLARTRHHFLCLAENLEGWRNLSRLSSKGYLEGNYYKPRIDEELLHAHSKGIIATSACIQGPVAQAILQDNPAEASRLIDLFSQIFGVGNFYLEIMDHGIPEEKKVNEALVKLAKKHKMPIVATNDCHYLRQTDADTQDCLMCISMGKKLADPQRLKFDQQELYVKSPEQMIQMFGHIDGAINNTLEVAERVACEIPLNQKLLPKFKTPNGESAAEYMRELTERGLVKRYGDPVPGHVRERAEFEFGVIEKMGFLDYFLVVQDFIIWAKDHDIPVGPGRGSGAGSIIAYALGITNLEPLEHNLLFERFLNPERVSMPDFDIDFCIEGRARVINYVRELYGEDCVSQIITFGKMKAKAAVRDVGRVMGPLDDNDVSSGMTLSRVNQIAKMVPNDLKITLPAALGQDDNLPEDKRKKLFSPELKEEYDKDPEVHELLERAKQVEGAIRQPGMHAAGVVICDQPLVDLIPLFRPAGDETAMPVTQFNMTEVEELGLLKMDFLGLKNLTLIKHCLETVNERFADQFDKPLEADDIPLDDAETYKLLQAGRGLGVFQLESSGMRELLTNFKPTKFSDVVALISLYRPGPMDNIPEFIARKEGNKEIVYEHPAMEPILRDTYGLFVYQEQVMQTAQKLGGYSLGGADMLRRAMSKKKAEEMVKHRKIFTEGCAANDIDGETAARIYDTMEKFADYGFNKSHAAAYSVVTIQTAYLKAHYPVDFFAALIAMEVGGEDAKISAYFDECREQGIRILPPDVNTSGVRFTPVDSDIRFGMCAIKGVGEAAVEQIVAERNENGPFKSLQEFVERCDKKAANSRVVECLVKAGAFDEFGHNRPSLLAALPNLMGNAGMAQRERNDQQTSLFQMMNEDQAGGLKKEMEIKRLTDWPEKQRLETEKELVGFYMTGHPLQRFEPDFKSLSSATAVEIQKMAKRDPVSWCGLIKRLVPRTDKNGRMFAFAECEDSTGAMELTFFSDAFDECRPILVEGEVIHVEGRVDEWRDTKKILVNKGMRIDEAREKLIRAIEITLGPGAITEANLQRIRELIAQHKGRNKLWLHVKNGAGELRVATGAGHGVKPATALIRELQDLDWVHDVKFVSKNQ